jgi:hypothetical protein
MKMTDPGLPIHPNGERTYQGQTYETAKVTFGQNVGDSPKNWCVIYRNPETHRLEAIAYIVTYDKSVQKPSRRPTRLCMTGSRS